MPYDIFISYSRKDNENSRVTDLKARIEAEYLEFAKEELKCFFDQEEIKGMEDWKHRLLKELRDSDLMLLILSPNYLDSPYCEWEIVEYLKYEYARASQGEGVAQVYFIEVPGLDEPGFQKRAKKWLEQISQRQRFSFFAWYNEGADALKRADVKKRLNELKESLHHRITRMRRITSALGNLPAPNARFVGRQHEMKLLHESVGLGRFGVFTAVHGMGGLGKTAIAFQYAYAYADFYPGGRWLIGCAGETNLAAVLKKLANDLDVTFTEDEKKDDVRGAKRILNELENLAVKGSVVKAGEKCPPKPAALLLLDNVDSAELLQSSYIDLVSGKEWLKVLVTTRLGPEELGDDETKQTLLTIDELPFDDALSLIESYQPGSKFPDEDEKEKAGEIVSLLGGYTLAVEVVALYMFERKGQIRCSDFLKLLRREGDLAGVEIAASKTKARTSVDHAKLISATLNPTLDVLSPSEKLVLQYAALLPPDTLPVTWLRDLVASEFHELGEDAAEGLEDPWMTLINHLLSLRLFQLVDLEQDKQKPRPRLLRMHRLVRQLLSELSLKNPITDLEKRIKTSGHIFQRSYDISTNPVNLSLLWEVDCLYRTLQLWINTGQYFNQRAVVSCCSVLREYGRYRFIWELAELTVANLEKDLHEPEVSVIWLHNMAGVAALYLDETSSAESHFVLAKKLADSPQADDMDKLDTLTNIGCLYRETFRPDLALRHSREALMIAENAFGKDSPQAALRCVNLGLVLQEMCNLQEAISLFNRAVEIDLHHPELSVRTCQDLSTLAYALRNAGRTDQAEEMIAIAQEIAAQSGYHHHPVSINVANSMACILEDKQQYPEARTFLTSALEITRSCYGDESSHRSVCYNNLGINSILCGSISSSVNELELALKIETGRRKPVNQKLAHRELNLGMAYLLSDDLTKAINHLNAGWHNKLKTGSPDLLSARLLLGRLAASFFTQENYDQFIGQLQTWLKLDVVIAAGVDIIWSLENPLKEKIVKQPREQIRLWSLACEAVTNKAKLGIKDNIIFRENVQYRGIEEEWFLPEK